VWLVTATDLAQKFNALIAGSDGGNYQGGSNPGVMVRTPDFFDDGGNQRVLPASMWHNDIYAPSQMYPTVASPWCPNHGSDGYYNMDSCDDDPWHFAAVAVVMADSMKHMWDDFSNIQNDGWKNGVFYASDANAADLRCIYRDDWSGYDCPQGFIDESGQFTQDDSKSGSGAYPPGNPDIKGTSDGGGGAGCHFDSNANAIDQPDAYDSDGNNLVQDGNCQCNEAYKGRWDKWVDSWSTNSQQKSGFEGRDWLDGSGNLAPAWGVDTGACWLNNPRDMIHLQNALYWQRSSWNNQLVPESHWDDQSSTIELRKYWGWNEIPVAKSVVNDANNWDAIVIKLPADLCNQGDYGKQDDPSCLQQDALQQLENDLDQFVNNNKLVLGAGNVGSHPGSAILFAKEFGTTYGTFGETSWGVNWSREFFCTNWVSPNQKYQVVSKSDGSCYIDAAGHSPSPSPSPPSPSPSPTPSAHGIANQKSGLCLSTKHHRPHNGDAVTVAGCDERSAGWTFQNGGNEWKPDAGRIVYKNLCLDATDMQQGNSLILWECNGQDQQEWTSGSDNSLQTSNSICLDSWSDSNGAGLQLWNCNSMDNQKWLLPSATWTMI
jgi:hypothetical protein